MREGINATSQASAFDWLHAPDELRVPRERCESGRWLSPLRGTRSSQAPRAISWGISSGTAFADELQPCSAQESGRYFGRPPEHLQPFHVLQKLSQALLPATSSGALACVPATSATAEGPCSTHLQRVSFAIVTTTRLLYSRAAVIAHSLRRQGARIEVFSDTAAEPGVRALPISGASSAW